MVHEFGLLRRGALVVLLACSAALGVAVPTATAAKTKTVKVGQLSTPNAPCMGPFTALQTGVSSGRSYTVPKKGVITSWSWKDGATTVSGLKLAVGRSEGGGVYEIVASEKAGTQKKNKVNTYKAHIRVKAGDLIGILVGGGGPCLTETGNMADTFALATFAVPLKTPAPFTPASGGRFPVAVSVTEG